MIWEHFLPALIAAIPGTLALIYGTMREFPRLLMLLLTVLGIARSYLRDSDLGTHRECLT